MSQWIQVMLTIIYLVWLFVVLFVLWRVWQKQVQRLASLEQSLIQDSKKTASAAEKSAEAACMLAAQLQTKIIEGKTVL
jgi:hypothetical protein